MLSEYLDSDKCNQLFKDYRYNNLMPRYEEAEEGLLDFCRLIEVDHDKICLRNKAAES
jgi:hypothetical protein